jgi:hypothetical protein
MTLVFAGCVALATAMAGYIFTQIVQFAGPISRIPIIEETTKGLEGKTNELLVSVAQSQLGYTLNDLASVKSAVKAVDVRPTPTSTGPTEYAFPGWRGVAISDVKAASAFLVKSRPESATAWIYSTDANLTKSLSDAQPAPAKFELDPKAFLDWSGVPIVDALAAAKVIGAYNTKLGQVWLYSNNLDFASTLATTQKK